MSGRDVHERASFVCCIEAGPLEENTVRLIESLRRWGGRFSKCHVAVVTPRPGPAISKRTKKLLQELDTIYINEPKASPYPWFSFLNKPLAVSIADKILPATESLIWIDSDVLVLSEPVELLLRENEDVKGCVSDKEMGSSGEKDAFEPIWKAACETLDLQISTLPKVDTILDKERIHLYWNGGVFSFRRSTGFAIRYLQVCIKLLEAKKKLNHKDFSMGFNEMSAIGFAAVIDNLRWGMLPITHNYPLSSLTPVAWYSDELLKSTCLLHYHDSMWPWFFTQFTNHLAKTHVSVSSWLLGKGALRNGLPLISRIIGRLNYYSYERTKKKYLKSCQEV